jgi:hypothetical protein
VASVEPAVAIGGDEGIVAKIGVVAINPVDLLALARA